MRQVHSCKLTYLTAPEIGADERIKRAIEIYNVDLHEYERLPLELRTEPSQSQKELVSDWYKEVTGGRRLAQPIQVQSIFDSIGDPSEEHWPKDRSGKPVNPVYTLGYHINSAITHGNLWAIKHYGLTPVEKAGGVTTALPGLDANGIRSLRKGAATLLQLSFGFAVQFMHGDLPSGVMNRLGAHIQPLMNS